MIPHELDDLAVHVKAIERKDAKCVEERQRRPDAGFVVAARTRSAVDKLCRRLLAKIVSQGSEHHSYLSGVIEFVDQLSGLVNDHHRVDVDVTLRVPFRFLRYTNKRLHFGEKLSYDTKLVKPLQSDRRRLRLQEKFLKFAPDTFFRKVCNVDLFADLNRFRIDKKLEPRRELCGAQNPQRVLSESLA